MRPQSIVPIHAETSQTYLDAALAAGSRKVLGIKRLRAMDQLSHNKRIEIERLVVIREQLIKTIMRVHDSFPSFDHLSEFLTQLFEQELQVAKVRQALGGINGACVAIRTLTSEIITQIKATHHAEHVIKLRSSYIGRVSSIVKMTDKHFEVLNRARDALRDLPSVDDELFTVAIAGFPNVGKSTLLSKLTTAKPEIKPYAFTTKGLNVGYFDYRYVPVQCIDTPGTLNRTRVNPIERKAEIAMRYLAKMIVYVFDPTEGNYSLEEQDALFEKTKQHLDVPILVYVSKSDIADEKKIQQLLEKYPRSHTVPDDVKKEIVKELRKEMKG